MKKKQSAKLKREEVDSIKIGKKRSRVWFKKRRDGTRLKHTKITNALTCSYDTHIYTKRKNK